MKDGRYIDSALRQEGLRKADIEVALRQQNANGPEEVAAATLTLAVRSSSGSNP